jgi:TPR repeat protein
VPRNVHEGAAWYRAAAEKGDAIARYNLGVVYEHGMGVAADRAEALRWYRAAADAGAGKAEAALRRLGE